MSPKILLAALLGGMFAGCITYYLIGPRAGGLPVTAKAQLGPRLLPVAAAGRPMVITSAVPPDAEVSRTRPSPFHPSEPRPELKKEAAQQAPATSSPEPVEVAQSAVHPDAVAKAEKEIDLTRTAFPRDSASSNGPHTVTVPSGTILNVRLGETLSTGRNLPGDTFHALLEQPLVAGGFVIAEKGARAEGRVLKVDRSQLLLELSQVNTTDGQRLPLRTSPFSKDSANAPVQTKLAFTTQAPVTITERVLQ